MAKEKKTPAPYQRLAEESRMSSKEREERRKKEEQAQAEAMIAHYRRQAEESTVIPVERYDGLERNQFLYNREIKELTQKAMELDWSPRKFRNAARFLEEKLGLSSEKKGVLSQAFSKTGEQLSAIYQETPIGKIQSWWNSPGLPIDETRFSSSGLTYRQRNKNWSVEKDILRNTNQNIEFAGMYFTGEEFLKAYGEDARIMNYLNESIGPKDLQRRMEAYSKELSNMSTISEAGVAGWTGYFVGNALLDPTNLIFTGAVVDLINTGRAAKRMKKLLDTGEEISPEQAHTLFRQMTGQSVRSIAVRGGIAGVSSMGVEAFFDDKVTKGDVLLAGGLSMALAGLIGGVSAFRKRGIAELQGQARGYFDDIMSETTSEVPARIEPGMGVDEVRAVLTSQATKSMNRFIREGIEAGRPMHIVAEEAVKKLNKAQQMVSRMTSLTFSDGKTISDLQTSEARSVRMLYAILGKHRLSFKDADVQMIETVSDMNATRNLRIEEVSSEVRRLGHSSETGLGRDKLSGLVIRQMEGRLENTPEGFFVKSDGKPMTETEIEYAKKQAKYLADKLRGGVYSEYEALAKLTGLRDPIDNYHPRTGRLREKLEDPEALDSFRNKYKGYLIEQVHEGNLEIDLKKMDAHIESVINAIKRGKDNELKPGETAFDYDHKESGELELIERDGSEFFTQKVSETGEMQRRSLVGPTGKDGKPIDIPYDIMEDLYPNAHDHLIGSAKRHSATTNGAILSTIGAPKGQSLPEFRTAEQPFPATPRPVEGEAPGVTPENPLVGPLKPGEFELPSDDYVRFYHYTRGDVEDLQREGIRFDKAEGETYGESNQIWASTEPPPKHHNFVEFIIRKDDPRFGGSIGKWQKGESQQTFMGDILPSEIVAVHTPESKSVRTILDDKKLLQEVRDLSPNIERLLRDKPDSPQGKAVAKVREMLADESPADDLTITSHAEDMTYNVIPAGKAAESDNPAQFLEDTRPVVDELNAASKNMDTAKEKEANSNMAVTDALEAERGRRTDLDERQIADLEMNKRGIEKSSKDADIGFKEWDKSENQVDRLESKEARILDRFESEKARTQTRLDELEAKQRESQEQGHVPVQPDAFELNQVTDEIAKLLNQDIAKKGKHQERVFNKIGKTQKEIDVLEAQRILLEWEIGGRKYDAEDTSTVLTGEIYGLTKTTIKQAQELLGENASVPQILKNFSARDSEKALELVNRQLQKKSEELNTRMKDYETLEPQGLTGKRAEQLEKLKARHEELLEHIRVHGDKTPAEYRRSLERTRQEKIDVLRKTLDEWGDPIKDGGLSKAFRDHVGDRAGRFEELLEDLRVLREPEGEGSLQVARKASEEKMLAYEDAVRRLDEDLDADRLNKWLKKNGSDAVKKEIQELKDQLKARRAERQQDRGELSEARKRLRQASKDYTDTFGERHTLDDEVDLGKVNSRISSIRNDSAMRNMSMGIGRQDGKYMPLSYGYGKEINDEYARMIEDAGDDVALVEKLERERDAEFQKLGELRDSFLGQNGKDQRSDLLAAGSMYRTSTNISVSTLADIGVAASKSNSGFLRTAEAVSRSLASVVNQWFKKATGKGFDHKNLAQFVEATEIEGTMTAMSSGRMDIGSSQGSIRLSLDEKTRTDKIKLGTAEQGATIWGWATGFKVVQPMVRGVATRLHTSRALDIGEKIFYKKPLTEPERVYVRSMGLTEGELQDCFTTWVKNNGGESVTGTGLKNANPEEWGNKQLSKKFHDGVMKHVESSSLKTRKEDRLITTKRTGSDPVDGFIDSFINTLQGFSRTAFKEYGLKGVQALTTAYQHEGLKATFPIARNVLVGGSIMYGVKLLRDGLTDSLGRPPYEDKPLADKVTGVEGAQGFIDFLSYTGLFGTLLDIPRNVEYGRRKFERSEDALGTTKALGIQLLDTASPGFGGYIEFLDGAFKVTDYAGMDEDEVRRQIRKTGLSPFAPIKPPSMSYPLLNVLIDEAAESGLIEEVPRVQYRKLEK